MGRGGAGVCALETHMLEYLMMDQQMCCVCKHQLSGFCFNNSCMLTDWQLYQSRLGWHG